MKDQTFLNELRRRASVLEDRYEAMGRDLKAVRVALAMFERESINHTQVAGNFSQAEIMADIIVGALSHKKEMHRSEILGVVISNGIHVGYDNDNKKQLSALSTLLSKDARFKPVKGKNGYWSLTRTETEWSDIITESSETPLGSQSLEFECGGVDGIALGNGVVASGRVSPIGHDTPLCQSGSTLEDGFSGASQQE